MHLSLKITTELYLNYIQTLGLLNFKVKYF